MNHIGTKEIKTERLLLRRFCIDDIESVYKNYGSDPKENRYISFAPCKTKESTREFIQMHVERYGGDLDFYGWQAR